MRKSTFIINSVFLPTTLALSMMLVAVGDKSASNNSAANIDPNVLADKQELVINNGAEPESLDPHKVSGVPESTFYVKCLGPPPILMVKLFLVWLKAGKAQIIRFGLSRFVTQNGQMAIQ